MHRSLDPDPAMGFHGLKELLTTREFLKEHCEFLATCVREAAWATRGAAYVCRRSSKGLRYLGLLRGTGATHTHLEAQYERAICQKWKAQDGVPECGWHRILDYQIPVSDRKRSLLGLKAIDLLGVTKAARPVVIELKIVRKGKGADSPLRALLEAASYACVIQADWVAFRGELESAIKHLDNHASLPEELEEVPLVIAGPPDYWEFWNYAARSSVLKAKPAFRKLVDAFRHEGFPVFFATVDGDLGAPDQLIVRPASFLNE